MPMFQNYLPQMSNMYNPYQNYLQNYQQSLQQPVVPTQISGANQMSALGKIVDSVDVVKATDVPMDGNIYYFPKADGTEVFAKQWLNNGTTQILTFKPVLDDKPNNLSSNEEKLKIGLSDEVTEVLMKRFDDIENRIDSIITKNFNKTSTKTRTTQEKE